jgi:hypothetical protein
MVDVLRVGLPVGILDGRPLRGVSWRWSLCLRCSAVTAHTRRARRCAACRGGILLALTPQKRNANERRPVGVSDRSRVQRG